MAMQSPIHPGKTSNRQHDRKYQQNQAAPSETTETFSRRRRFNPGVHQVIRYIVIPLQRITINDSKL
jgi:hypothetical protein